MKKSRKKLLETKVKALCNRKSQSTLDAFLVRHHYSKHQTNRENDSEGKGEGEGEGEGKRKKQKRREIDQDVHGADRDGEREARLEAAETVEDLISDESENESDAEENESSRRRRRLSKAELPVEKTTRRLGIMTDLELEKLKEEEKEALVRLSRRSVPNHRRPSPMSVLLALRGLTTSCPRRQCVSMRSLASGYGLFRKVGVRTGAEEEEELALMRSQQSETSSIGRGLTCLEMDSKGCLLACGTQSGHIHIYKPRDLSDKILHSFHSDQANRTKANEDEDGNENEGCRYQTERPVLTVPTKNGFVRSIQWNPRDENEIALISGFGRQVKLYDLTRWKCGSPPTRTLVAPNAHFSSGLAKSSSNTVHNAIIQIKHLESMGQYVVAAGTGGGELLLWDTRCPILQHESGLHDHSDYDSYGLNGENKSRRHSATPTSTRMMHQPVVSSLSAMLKQNRQDLSTTCALRRGTSALVGILESGNNSGVLHAVLSKGEVVAWDLRRKICAGFSGQMAFGGQGKSFFHPLHGSWSLGKHLSKVVRVVQDPQDSRQFGWTGISEDGSVCGVSTISPTGLKPCLIWKAESEVGWSGNPVWNGNAFVTSTYPTPPTSEYEGGESLEGDYRERVSLKIFPSSEMLTRPLAPVSVPLCSVATCMASHPFTDDLFCGTKEGILCVYKHK